ncbi:MAG: hypothetical protein IJB35_00840 [Oscillospiraceae bacterium]|nr:hypothetical protein [Oscillospiraceae bacterium]
MNGKKKCKILREIRQKIASENDIPYVTSQCNFQGQCKGTCPKCEQELSYLEQQLAKRQQLGKLVTVSALALGLAVSTTGCEPPVLEGDVPYIFEEETTPPYIPEEETVPTEELSGTETTEDPVVLEGDVPYSEDTSEEAVVSEGLLPMPEESEGD